MVLIRILCLLSALQLSLAVLHEQKYYDDVWPGLEDILLRPELDMRVVGGDATTIQNIGGFLVSLYYEGEFVCGGTLIEERIVISAAHCFLRRTNKKQWTVKGGVTKRFEPGPIVEIDDYVSAAAFNSTKMHMDVAIISLARPLKGANIGYATLCSQKLTEGLELIIYGWGLTDPNAANPTQTVRTVTVPVIKKNRCREVYKAASEITGSMFCAGVLGSKDACTYDSGGPIVYKNGTVKELCGIVSFGVSCASPKFPGVYTDVNYVRPFIDATIRSMKNID